MKACSSFTGNFAGKAADIIESFLPATGHGCMISHRLWKE
jgi:hypothetical protein